MAYTQWPDAADLLHFIEGHDGIAVATSQRARLEPAVKGARELLERRAGRTFLAVTGTRTFDPPTGPNGQLEFGDDLASLTSLSYNGRALTAGTDFRLWRLKGSTSGPFCGVKFNRRWYATLPFADEQSLSVVGAWGYATELPAAVWEAVLNGAASTLAPHLRYSTTQGRLSYERAGVSEDFGVEPFREIATGWQATFDAAAETFARRLW